MDEPVTPRELFFAIRMKRLIAVAIGVLLIELCMSAALAFLAIAENTGLIATPFDFSTLSSWSSAALLVSVELGLMALCAYYFTKAVYSRTNQMLVFNVDCQNCERVIAIAEPWTCPRCKSVSKPHLNNKRIYDTVIGKDDAAQKVRGYALGSFISKCEHCHREPPAIVCPGCRQAIQLGEEPVGDEPWWARLLVDVDDDTKKQLSKTDPKTIRRDTLRQRIDERMGVMADLQIVKQEFLDEARKIADEVERERYLQMVKAAFDEIEDEAKR